MLLFLSKFLPLLIYPLGLTCILLVLALSVQRRRSWQTVLIVLTFALLWLGGNRIVTMALVSSLERQYLPPTQLPDKSVVVVLGGGTRAGVAPRPINEVNEAGDRVLYAAWLYKQGKAAHLLLSGGNAPWSGLAQTLPEAEVMASILDIMGVPRTALWLESNSRNTEENAVESRKILDQEGVHSIILVTSALHMPRAVRLFEQQGLTVIPAPTDFMVTDDDWAYYTQPSIDVQLMNLMPSADDLQLTSRAIKEQLGALFYRLRGWR
jgi:uncharacterized SAM-binding protein YcdF (DUF218 family)